MSREPAVYIMASKRNGTLYTGVTSNLARRVHEHREGLTPGFTTRYGCKKLVYYEHYDRIVDAIAREKQIKGGSRAKKLALIDCDEPRLAGPLQIPCMKAGCHCERSEAIGAIHAAGSCSLHLLRLRLAMTAFVGPCPRSYRRSKRLADVQF